MTEVATLASIGSPPSLQPRFRRRAEFLAVQAAARATLTRLLAGIAAVPIEALPHE